jgi:hypothetical protein
VEDPYRTINVLDNDIIENEGGARGLAFSWPRGCEGCAEVGANVAVIDCINSLDPEFKFLRSELGLEAKFYQCVYLIK